MIFLKINQIIILWVLAGLGLSAAQTFEEFQNLCAPPRNIDSDLHIVAAKTIRPKKDFKVLIKSNFEHDAVFFVAGIKSRRKNSTDDKAATVMSTSDTINPNEQITLTLKVDYFSPLQDYYLFVRATNASLKESFSRDVNQNTPFSGEDRLVVVQDHSIVLIQFDKPKYQPGEMVNYNIIVVNENLLPVDAFITVNIKNPKGEFVHQETSNSTLFPEYPGFLRGQFETSKFQSLGQWELEVKTGKQIETRKFEVSEYVLPRFSVNLITPPYVYANESDDFVVMVEAKKPYSSGVNNLPVKSRYHLNVTGPNNIVKTLEKESDRPVNFTISLDEVTKGFCNGAVNQTNGLIKVSVTATENVTGKQQSEWVSLPFYCNSLVLHVKTKSLLFHPETPYELDVEIRGHDGKRFDGKFSPTEITVDVVYSDSLEKLNVDSGLVIDHNRPVQIDAKNQAKIVLIPKARTQRIDVVLKLQNFQKNFNFYGFQISPSKRYMTIEQITAVPKPGEEAKFRISCTQNCSAIQYIVILQDASILSGTQRFPEFPKTSQHELSLKMEQSMTPSATLVVYYLTPSCGISNRIISASIKFNVDGFIQNKVNLSITPETGMDYILPGQDPKQKAVLKVNTDPGSLVGTLALDTRLVQIGKANNLTNEGLLREVFNLEKRRAENYTPSTMLSSVSDTFETSGLISFILRSGDALYPVMSSGHGENSANNIDVVSSKQNAPEWKSSKRTDFRDSFFFNVYTADPFGNVEKSEVVPDSITTWEVSAFSLNSRTGLAFSQQPAKLRIFQPVFVEIVRPFNMIRNENATVDFIISSYLNTTESIQLEYTLKYLFAKPNVIITGRKRNKVGPNESVKESITINPTEIDQISIHAKIIVFVGEEQQYLDEVIEKMRVISEGIKREVTSKTFPVAPGQVLEMPINISQISPRFINGSQAIRLSLFADEWAPVLNTLSSADKSFEGLIKLPSGCGEQNMALFMPNFFIAKYLQKIGKWIEKPRRREQLEKNLAIGYEKQFNYRLSDYSFSTFGKSPGSTWLTAYVMHGFSSAKNYIKKPKGDLDKSFDFLEKQQTKNGSFMEVGSLVDRHHAGHATDGGSAALTAFVVLAFVEGNRTGSVTDKAKRYLLEALPQIRESPYTLAIVTYALAKLKSPEARAAAQRLIEMKIVKEKENFIYWTENPNEVSVSGKTVETTAYAMLALETLGLHNETMAALKWLLSIERNINGGFVSTQDTVVALTAISKIAANSRNEAVKLSVKIRYEPSNKEDFKSIGESTILFVHNSDAPPDTTNMVVTATGKGRVQARISYIFNEPPSESAQSKFHLKADTVPDLQQFDSLLTLSIECRLKGLTSHVDGQVLIEVPALTGYTFDENTNETLTSDESLGVGKVELGPRGSSAKIYLEKLDRDMKTFKLSLQQTGEEVNAIQPRTIKIYEYFEPHNFRSCNYSPS